MNGISREEFVASWVRAAAKPEGDLKNFATDLTSWAGNAGRRTWVKERFGAAVTDAVTTARRPAPEPGPWDAVSELFDLAVDGLARVTCALRATATAAAPKRLTAAVNSQIRECARSVGTEMRTLLTTPGELFGDVLADEDTAKRFLTATNIDALRPVAMRAFVSKVAAYVEKNRAALLERDLLVLDAWLIEATAAWGAPIAGQREPTPAEQVSVEALLVEELSRRRAWFFDSASGRAELVGEAWRRARQTLLKQVVEGKHEIVHAGILYTKVKALEKEKWRPRKDETDSIDADPTLAERLSVPDRSLDGVALRTVFDAAARWLDGYPEPPLPTPSWELRTAQTLLRAVPIHLIPGTTLQHSDIRALVVRLWRQDSPADARSNSAAQAAGYVVTLARLALARHIDAVEDFALAGAPDEGQTNLDRYTQVHELLTNSKETEP